MIARTLAGVAAALLMALALAGCIASADRVKARDGQSVVESGEPHPLDPLTRDEVEIAASVVSSAHPLPATRLFPVIALNEPPKDEVLAYRPGAPMRREARVTVMDREANKSYDAVVDLVGRKLLSWNELKGGQPLLTWAEFDTVPAVVRADPRWQEAMRRRGINDFSRVHLDVWAPGYQRDARVGGPRVARAISFYRGPQKNGYGRPIEGVIARVDLNRLAVIDVLDSEFVPVALTGKDLDLASLSPQRAPGKPLHVVQPEGPSFAVKGHEVSWDRWRFRYRVDPREGLVLQQIAYQDGDSLRSVLYRASVSEMVVPYGDPDPAWVWRSAFDEGEYGLGKCMTSLERGGEVPENAVLLDAELPDETGGMEPLPAAVGLYERDGGVLWKHYDEDAEQLHVRRARELVMVSWVTIGNYDYGFHWIFRQDGSLELEVELSGILLAKGVRAATCAGCSALARGAAVDESAETRHGVLVGEGVLAPNHQHFVNVRLDLDVDGPINSVLEMNARTLRAGGENPNGNAVVMEKRVLATERAARRGLDAAVARKWEVFNPGRTNALGHLSGYALVPGENSAYAGGPRSPLRRRAGFVEHPVWVTRHKPDELYAAGDLPNQGSDGAGLPRYSGNESIVGTDLVLWYTFGVTHGARAEEWPVMPVHRVGFRLVPRGFFSRNPALDVPPTELAEVRR